MSAKFTPGPWTVGGGTGRLNQIAIDPAIGCAYGAGEEVVANARLIAAAPDLLAALIEVTDLLDMATGVNLLGLPPGADGPAVAARAAIAKATGSGQ